jgi:hypothetical protein
MWPSATGLPCDLLFVLIFVAIFIEWIFVAILVSIFVEPGLVRNRRSPCAKGVRTGKPV